MALCPAELPRTTCQEQCREEILKGCALVKSTGSRSLHHARRWQRHGSASNLVARSKTAARDQRGRPSKFLTCGRAKLDLGFTRQNGTDLAAYPKSLFLALMTFWPAYVRDPFNSFDLSQGASPRFQCQSRSGGRWRRDATPYLRGSRSWVLILAQVLALPSARGKYSSQPKA
jgi:hypothetical protein